MTRIKLVNLTNTWNKTLKKMNSHALPTPDKNMVTLLSFPFPPSKPNMLIKPKVFCMTFRMKSHSKRHIERIVHSMKQQQDNIELDMLKTLCTQTLQLRRTAQDDDIYNIIIENISNRALKTNLLNTLAAAGNALEPIATAEIVNSNLTWAKLYMTSTWQEVRTVLLLSMEKEQLMQLASGEIVEMEVYNDMDPVLHIQSWNRVPYQCQ